MKRKKLEEFTTEELMEKREYLSNLKNKPVKTLLYAMFLINNIDYELEIRRGLKIRKLRNE